MNDRKKITPAFLAEGTEKEVREAVWPKRFILRQTLGAKKPDPPTPKTAEGRELAGKAF